MSDPSRQAYTGGCQCGAVRFKVGRLGRASLCHCRMCQKAFGSIGGLLVGVHDLTWTRGEPKHFKSSSVAKRGFCGTCGTPLTFELDQGSIDIAIAAFDHAAQIVPVVQMSAETRLPYFDTLPHLPHLSADEMAEFAAHYGSIVSRQHPDHD